MRKYLVVSSYRAYPHVGSDVHEFSKLKDAREYERTHVRFEEGERTPYSILSVDCFNDDDWHNCEVV